MTRVRRCVFLPAALAGMLMIVAHAPAQQLDWGGTFDSATNLRDDPSREDTVFQQSFRLGLWAEVFAELRDERTVRFTAEGSYRLEYDEDDDDHPLHVLNPDLLRLRASFPLVFGPGSTLDFTAGRFRFGEPTGAIWNHPGDGLSVEARLPRVWVQVAGAYTGLLLNPVSDIRMTQTDLEEEDDTDELFGPRRAIGRLQLQLPELIGRQRLTGFGIVQVDLRDPDDGEETLDTQYVGLRLDGPVEPVRGLYYEVFGARGFGTFNEEGNGDTSVSSGLYGARVRYFRERLRYSRLFAEWLHASGGDALDPFVAINAPAAGFAFSPDLANLMLATAGYSLRPFSDSASAAAAGLQAGITARGYFRSTTKDVFFDAPGVDADSDSRYAGAEGELRLASRPTADLGFAFTSAVFFPNDDLFVDSDPWYRGRFELSIGL